jgi:hypothetical protein
MSKWKGNNELLLNGATMVEAVQMWLDSTLSETDRGTVRIVSVEQKDNSAYSRSFTVKVEEVEGDGAT